MFRSIFSSFLILLVFSAKGQQNINPKFLKADKDFDSFAYVKARDAYFELSKDTIAKNHVIKRLSECYYKLSDWKNAELWLAKAVLLNGIEANYLYLYAHSLKGNGKYAESDEWMEEYNLAAKHDTRAIEYNENKNELQKLLVGKSKFKVENVPINTPESDFGPSYFKNDEIVFASSRQAHWDAITRTYSWNEHPFLDVFVTESQKGILSTSIEFYRKIDSQFHDGPVCFNSDFTIMYLTRNNFNNNKSGKSKDGVNKLKLYRSAFKDDKWDDLEELPFNNNEYSVGHASLSKDGKKLYFSSDMPGGIGGTDIYFVDVNTDGTFGKPVNLGKNINTEGSEMFPFIHPNKNLFYSSDGHQGLGHLDIFYSGLQKDGTYGKSKNIGLPINSEHDDFAIILNPGQTAGYFSSNRDGGKGDDDIYSFKIIGLFSTSFLLDGVAVDKETGIILPGSLVTLNDNWGAFVDSTRADENGSFAFEVDEAKTYCFIGQKENYIDGVKKITLEAGTEDSAHKVKLELSKYPIPKKTVDPVKKQITPGADLAKIININPIYFDYTKFNIRKDAAIELDKIVKTMNEYPTMVIELGSHTDCRASYESNRILSDKRAKASAAYIISKGIDKSRIYGKGYGESKLLNNCPCEGEIKSTCSEQEHQQNRRTEFVIIKM